MTQREYNKLDRWERAQAIRHAAEDLNAALNLFGSDAEPITNVTDATDERTAEREMDRLMTPECSCRRGTCDHAFPAWFVREAQPQAKALLRLVIQDMRATSGK